MSVIYNDRGFQLGNLLYLLLQAHIDKDHKVLRAGYWKQAVTMFPKTAELFTKANGQPLAMLGYCQEHGKHYSSEQLDDFVRKYLLDDIKLVDLVDCTLAIRRTDYLLVEDGRAYGYDTFDYLEKCLNSIDTTGLNNSFK